MLKENKWISKNSQYHPPIQPSQKTYMPLYSSRSFSRRIQLQTPQSIRSSVGHPMRSPAQSQSFHISLQQIPNDRLRVACVELQYILSKNGFMIDEVQKAYANILVKISQEVERLGEVNVRLQRQQLGTRPQSPIHQVQPGNCLATNKLKKMVEEDKKDKVSEKDHLKIVMENTKLAALNQALALKVKQLSSHQHQAPMSQENIAQQKQKVHEAIDRCRYLDLKLLNEEKRLATLAQQHQAMKSQNLQFSLEIVDLKEKVAMLTEQRDLWRERSLKQTEDIIGHSQRQQMILAYVRKMKDTRRITDLGSRRQDQNNPTKMTDQFENFRLNSRGDFFHYQVDFFKQVRNLTDTHRVAQYRQPLKFKCQDLQAQVGNLQYQISNMRTKKQQQIYLPRYSYWRPTFYNMIEHLPTPTQREVQRTFIQKIRSIMNSKLNEFMLINDVDSYTRFPEFVLNWLERYDFEPSTKEIVVRPVEEQSSAREFYSDLMNYKVGQNWEIISFREFLLEEMSLEELYFYLQCQNILFRRCGITLEQQYVGDFIILVDFAVAKSVVSVILSEFDSWNINYFLGKLGERMIIRNNRQMIDSGFCLRCLLEFYKLERVNRFRFIENSVKQHLEDMKIPKLGFSQFMIVFREFTELSYLNKIKIYRECYSVGRGAITPQVIFTVCTETRVFLSYLRIKTFYRLPILRTSQQYSQIQPPLPYLPKLFEQMRDLLSPHSEFSQKVRQLGVQQISTHIQQYRKYFLQKRLVSDNSIMRCKHFIHYIGELLTKIKLVNYSNLYSILEDADRRTFKFVVEIEENRLGELYYQGLELAMREFQQTQDIIQWGTRVRQFREHRAAKRIQRYIRAKFIQPYLELYSSMLAKARTIAGHNMSATVPSKAFAQLKHSGHHGRRTSMQTKGKKTFS